MKTTTFEKLFIWQESKELFLYLYSEVNKPNFKDYFYKEQLLRATLSISNNIAEGLQRKTKKEIARFLYFYKGSCGEVRSMLLIGKDLKYFNEKEIEQIISITYKLSAGIENFIKKIN